MLRISLQCCCLAGLVFISVSCQRQPVADPVSPADATAGSVHVQVEPADDAPPDATGRSPVVELTIATFDELQKSIAASRGKVVVVDYWSTQCPPCMTEFPGLVAIHNEMSSGQVRCVSVSLDYEGLPDFSIEEARKSSLEFLKQKHSTLDNFILSEDSLTVMDDKLKIASMPAVFVFDVDGKLARQFDESDGNPFTYEKDITPFVKQLAVRRFPAKHSSPEGQ